MNLNILDTNILLLDAHNIFLYGRDSSIVVLPETVLDEIDSKKSGTSEIAYQAREFGRLLTKATRLSSNTNNMYTKVELHTHNTTIWVISLHNYPHSHDSERNISNDRKIIHVASVITNEYPDSTFISNDVMCRLRAESIGLTVADHKIVENTNISFTKELTVPTGAKLHNTPIRDTDPEYSSQNYNYIFTDELTGQIRLGTVSNGIISIIGKDTEKELRRQDINPINSSQLFLSKAIQDPAVDIVVCEAKAGTGKTAVAISNAIRLVRQGQYSSISYIRASIDDVDSVEQIGFLSGNEEKLAVYLHPIEDTLDYIIRSRYKDSKLKGSEYETFIEGKIHELKEQVNITAMIGLGMRGRTFNDTVAIIDEAQGMSKASLQKVLTRFGKNCKIIIIGSNNQIDNPYLTKYTNGLSTILDACTRPHDNVTLHAVNLTKVVRSAIAEFAEDLFTERNT